jgi:hypothetical protein
MVSRFEQIDYVKYDTYLFVNLVLVLTRKAVLFALDLSLGFALLTSSLGSSANKISYFVRTRLNWNKQIRIITNFQKISIDLDEIVTGPFLVKCYDHPKLSSYLLITF